MRTLLAALILCAFAIAPAAAHPHRHYHRHHRHFLVHVRREHVGWPAADADAGSNVARARARGLPWCGAFLADFEHVTGALARKLWVARNWAVLWGRRAFGPAPGEVVVWPHHVGIITKKDPQTGKFFVLSGNDGHRVRERPRSLHGAIAFRVAG